MPESEKNCEGCACWETVCSETAEKLRKAEARLAVIDADPAAFALKTLADVRKQDLAIIGDLSEQLQKTKEGGK